VRDRPHLAALLLRVGAEQRLGDDLASLAAGLIEAEHVRRPNFVLPLPPPLVGVALIISLAAGAADFEQEPTLRHVEKVGLLPRRRADGQPYKTR
jgi:hypothetical protein